MGETIKKNTESGTESVEHDVRELHAAAGDKILVKLVGCGVSGAEHDGKPDTFPCFLEGAGSEKTKNSVFKEMGGFADKIN